MDDTMFETLFREDLIVMNSAAATREEALAELAEMLRANNYVHASFAQAVLHREDEFPTGLPTSPVGVAIPHTDVEHVISPAIAVSIVANPVQFNEMGNPDNQVGVRIIFMLAVNAPHMQLDLLKQLMSRISDANSLISLLHAQNKQEVLQVMGA
jgi:PTS system galactitol-specific IIA component